MVSSATIKSSIAWHTSSLAFTVLMQLAVLALLARLLEPRAFGLVAAANIAIDLCQLLSEAGAGAAVIHRQELDRVFIGTAMTTSLVLGLLLFLALVALSVPISAFLAMPDLPVVLSSLGGVFVLVGLARVPEALLQRDFRFQTLMKINVGAQLLGYAAPAVALALLGFGVWALVAGTLLQWLLRVVFLCVAVRERIGIAFSRESLRDMLGYSLGVTKEKIWNYVVVQGDRFIIGRRLGVEVLGQYHVIAVAMLPGRYFGDVLDNVFFPMLARIRDNRPRLARTWVDLVSNSFLFMFGVGAFLAANGPVIVEFAFGHKWAAAAGAFSVLCLTSACVMIIRMSDCLNRAVGNTHETARRKLVNAVLFVPVVWLSSAFGLVGVCVALVGLQAFNGALQFHLAWRALGLDWPAVSAAVRRVALGCAAVVAVNALSMGGVRYGGLAPGLALLLSFLASLAVAAVLFGPLVRGWLSGQDGAALAGRP